jgi:hypothetical protein
MKTLRLSRLAGGGCPSGPGLFSSSACGRGAAAASPTVTPAVGLPGAGAPSGTTLTSLVAIGSEFFLGDAASYHNAAAAPPSPTA